MTTIAEIRSATDAKMNQSLAAFQNNLTKIRTGRANPALLDLLCSQLVLGDGEKSVAIEPVDPRRHVAVYVEPAGDQFAFVALPGQRQ